MTTARDHPFLLALRRFSRQQLKWCVPLLASTLDERAGDRPLGLRCESLRNRYLA
jgi:hypothetical protein